MASTARLPMSARTAIHTWPAREGFGSARSWSRTIGEHRYGFRVVNMPDGEVRLCVSVYNGYGDDGTPESRAIGQKFGCAWTPTHFIQLRPGA